MHRKVMQTIAARKKPGRFIVSSRSDCYSEVEVRTSSPSGWVIALTAYIITTSRVSHTREPVAQGPAVA